MVSILKITSRSELAPGFPYSTSGSSLAAGALEETTEHILYHFSGAFPEVPLSSSDYVSLARTLPMAPPTIMEPGILSLF